MKVKYRYASEKKCSKEGCPVIRRDVIEVDESGNDQYRLFQEPRSVNSLRDLWPDAEGLIEQTFAACLICFSHARIEKVTEASSL